jgi:anti-sigma factor, putative, ChrR family
MAFESIDGDMLSAYASGSMRPALRVLVETRMTLLRDVASPFAISDAVGGACLSAETPSDLKPDAFDEIMKRIDGGPSTPRHHVSAAKAAGKAVAELLGLPEPLREYALLSASKRGWRFAGPGLRIMPLLIPGDDDAELIRIEPGFGAPTHTHRGQECTLVLSGAFADERGAYYPGQIAVADPNVVHRPRAIGDHACLCMAVKDAPLEFTGALGLLQKAFSIN